MRFFTVADAKEARKSVLYATGFIGYFYVLILVVGFGAIVMVGSDPAYRDAAGKLVGGSNMVAVHLAHAIGGDWFLGFISAVAFATILAVVAGLALSGASAVSHDLYANVFRRGTASEKDEIRVSKAATLVIGLLAMVLGVLFEKQNIAFLSGLVLAIAASVNFPVLFLSMFWKGLTTKGAVAGSLMGLASAVALLVLGPTVWVGMLHHGKPIFPYSNPALFSMTLAFVSAWLVSVLDKSAQAAAERQLLWRAVRAVDDGDRGRGGFAALKRADGAGPNHWPGFSPLPRAGEGPGVEGRSIHEVTSIRTSERRPHPQPSPTAWERGATLTVSSISQDCTARGERLSRSLRCLDDVGSHRHHPPRLQFFLHLSVLRPNPRQRVGPQRQQRRRHLGRILRLLVMPERHQALA